MHERGLTYDSIICKYLNDVIFNVLDLNTEIEQGKARVQFSDKNF